MKYSDQWEVDEKLPTHDFSNQFEVMFCGQKRLVKRAGFQSTYFSPGVLLFLDCTEPMQNGLCDESKITAWRFRLANGNPVKSASLSASA